jgi:hypothetical protein
VRCAEVEKNLWGRGYGEDSLWGEVSENMRRWESGEGGTCWSDERDVASVARNLQWSTALDLEQISVYDKREDGRNEIAKIISTVFAIEQTHLSRHFQISCTRTTQRRT